MIAAAELELCRRLDGWPFWLFDDAEKGALESTMYFEMMTAPRIGPEAAAVSATYPAVVASLVSHLEKLAAEHGADDPAFTVSNAFNRSRATQLQRFLDSIAAATMGKAIEQRLRREEEEALMPPFPGK